MGFYLSRFLIFIKIELIHRKIIKFLQSIRHISLGSRQIFIKRAALILIASKLKKKASQEKVKKWALIYKEELVNNINTYDEIIYSDIKSDFSSCMIKVKPII